MKRASGFGRREGKPMIAGSLNRLRRKGCTASNESGPPRLNRMMAIFMGIERRAKVPRCAPARRYSARDDTNFLVDASSPTELSSRAQRGTFPLLFSRRPRLPVAPDLDQLRHMVGWRLGHHAVAEVEHEGAVAELVEDARGLFFECSAAYHQHHRIEIALNDDMRLQLARGPMCADAGINRQG